MPWGVSMYSLLIYVLNSRKKGHGVGFGGVHLRGLRWYLSLSLGSEEDHGRTREGGAPAAPSVPVPRPVARGLADWRQVRMQLAPFTHGALIPLRICTPWEHLITLSKKYCLHFVSVVSRIQVCECFGVFYCQLCRSVVMDAATGLLVPLCAQTRLSLILLLSPQKKCAK